MLVIGHDMHDAGHIMQNSRKQLPDTFPNGTWIQTERAAHEAWAAFLGLRGATAASRVMHLLLARMSEQNGRHNAVIIAQSTLAKLLKCDERTVRRGVAMLEAHRWIEVRQIGDRRTVNAYIINDRVGWSGPRDGIRYSLFSAAVVISDDEQLDRDQLGHQRPLQRLPTLYPGERQLPSGDGLPPPSEPALPGMEPDLPAREMSEETAYDG